MAVLDFFGIKNIGRKNIQELAKLKDEMGFETDREALENVLKNFKEVSRAVGGAHKFQEAIKILSVLYKFNDSVNEKFTKKNIPIAEQFAMVIRKGIYNFEVRPQKKEEDFEDV